MDIFEADDNSTPLTSDEKDGLKLKWITLRSELNEVEARNIAQAQIWLRANKNKDIFSTTFLCNLYKKKVYVSNGLSLLKFFSIALCMLIFASCKNIYVNESLFNASEETIRAKYGVPYFEKTYLVTSEYKKYEEEPYYPIYFTPEDLQNGVEIKKMIFSRFCRNIQFYLKQNANGEWILFYDLFYTKGICF